jgi:hypothetical protein
VTKTRERALWFGRIVPIVNTLLVRMMLYTHMGDKKRERDGDLVWSDCT